MKTLGLDIGTTTISAVVFDETAGVCSSRTVQNDAQLTGKCWERLQDPNRILDLSMVVIQELLAAYPACSAIGVSCQMHGILYLDHSGAPVSPLFTWQDGTGALPYDDAHNWASHLSSLTGYPLSTGFGMVTHFYHCRQGLVPESAAVLCTIGDYVAMKLSGRTTPIMDATNAASLGLYDSLYHCFNAAALENAAISTALLPELVTNPCLGIGRLNIPVYAALGDNQASFLGATGGCTDALLVNMGTGGQISNFSPDFIQIPLLETRPFPGGGWLLVGASLCGGRSYALLERFFRDTVKMVSGLDISAYDAMAKAAASAPPENCPKILPLFQGTRQDPSLRGAIIGISPDNFTPLHFLFGLMQGMADELHSLYCSYLTMGGTAPRHMIGSGNGLRKNTGLCQIFESTFGLELHLSENKEEAACGAAIYAARHCKE